MRSIAELSPAPQSSVPVRYDAVVVGAGPYGLSTAAHLLGQGLRVAVFGRAVEFWRRHMPRGMLLRSHWWATNLSDPKRQYGFAHFCKESPIHRLGYPVPREAFVDYAHWFQEHAVPEVDNTYVASVRRQMDYFVLTLEDGREVHSPVVVMAIGLHYYAHRPEPFRHLPGRLVSHSCEHHDVSQFKGQRVVVVGGGQSAVEYAALLHEAGAAVHLVSRRPIFWLPPDRAHERGVMERILAPTAGIAPGWRNWILEHQPYWLYRLPQQTKDKCNRSYYAASATDWLRERVLGRVKMHESQTIVTLEARDRTADVVISDGQRVRADQVILATGYQVDIHKLAMLHPSLLAQIRTDMAIPILNPWFESSVQGLFFVGLTSMRAFGPLYRFVVGCHAAATRVAGAVARQRAGRASFLHCGPALERGAAPSDSTPDTRRVPSAFR